MPRCQCSGQPARTHPPLSLPTTYSSPWPILQHSAVLQPPTRPRSVVCGLPPIDGHIWEFGHLHSKDDAHAVRSATLKRLARVLLTCTPRRIGLPCWLRCRQSPGLPVPPGAMSGCHPPMETKWHFNQFFSVSVSKGLSGQFSLRLKSDPTSCVSALSDTMVAATCSDSVRVPFPGSSPLHRPTRAIFISTQANSSDSCD